MDMFPGQERRPVSRRPGVERETGPDEGGNGELLRTLKWSNAVDDLWCIKTALML